MFPSGSISLNLIVIWSQSQHIKGISNRDCIGDVSAKSEGHAIVFKDSIIAFASRPRTTSHLP